MGETEYEAIDDFDPEQIIKEEKKVKEIGTMGLFILAGFVPITAWVGAIGVVLTDYEKNTEYILNPDNTTTMYYSQKLPYLAWTPFDRTSSRLRYAIAATYSCIAAENFSCIISGKHKNFLSTDRR